jgi:hypothetical protein
MAVNFKIVIFCLGFLFVCKIGIEIAKAVYCSKNTDNNGTFATLYQTDKH